MGMSAIAILMALLGGTGNDLLDYVPTKAFWKSQGVEVTTVKLLAELKAVEEAADASKLIKQLGAAEQAQREQAQRKLEAMGPAALPQLRKAAKSPDAEVAMRVQSLIASLSKKGAARTARRLMAIRALGERKDRKAVAALRKLLKSKAVFEAEYAARAIAAIEGKPFKRSDVSTKAMASDLWLLPGNCAAVGQFRLPPGKPLPPGGLAKMLAPMMPEGGPGMLLAKLDEALIAAAVELGNVRLEGVTFGVADDVGQESGYVVLVVRGLYDPAAARSILIDRARLKPEKVGALELLRIQGKSVIILASKERLLFLAGASREKMPVEQMAAALKAGKGKLADNKQMAKLIKSVDRTGPIWAACRVSETYRKSSLLAPFRTLTLTTKRRPKELRFTLSASGTDAEKVAAAVKELNGHMAKAREELARPAERMPALKPVLSLLASIKATAKGANATVTGRLVGGPRTLLGMPALLWFSKGAARVKVVEEIHVEPAPAP